jgi:hypothetical protein
VRVLARKTVRVKAFRLGEALDWAVAQGRARGLEQVTVACEPTGPRFGKKKAVIPNGRWLLTLRPRITVGGCGTAVIIAAARDEVSTQALVLTPATAIRATPMLRSSVSRDVSRR